MLGIHYITFGVKSLEYAWDIQSVTIWEIVQNMLGTYYITFSVKSLEYALDILENFPDCGTLNIPCIFQRFYTKSDIMYLLNIHELPETRRF